MFLKCSKCKEKKPTTEFHKSKSHFNHGYQYYCKDCKREYKKNNDYSYKNYWKGNKLRREYLDNRKKVIKGFKSRDLLKHMGFDYTEDIYFDVNKAESRKLTIQLDNNDIKKLKVLENLFGNKPRETLRLILRGLCAKMNITGEENI